MIVKSMANTGMIGASCKTLLLAAAGLALVTAPSAQATDGYFLNGLGAKAKGAGGVAIAMPQDAMAIAANPAAATELGHRLDVGFEAFMPRRGADISGNMANLNGSYSGNGTKLFILPEIAYVRPLNETFSIGLAINGNGGMNTNYKRNPFANFGATGPAGVDLAQASITPTLAARVVEGHSVGVSPVIMVQRFRMRGIQPFTAASMDPAHMTNNGRNWSAGAGVRVGYLGRFADNKVSIGAFYQTKTWMGKFGKYSGLFAEGGDFDVPASWGVGLSVKPVENLTLGADFKRIKYSGVRSVGAPIDQLFAGNPFGSQNGPGFGWRDIDVIKFGAVYRASDHLTLRAGYGRSQNPVPRTQTFLNILAPGIVKDHFTAGATIGLSDKVELTSYIMHAPRKRVYGSNSIPMPYGGGEADIHLSETAFGMAAGFKF